MTHYFTIDTKFVDHVKMQIIRYDVRTMHVNWLDAPVGVVRLLVYGRLDDVYDAADALDVDRGLVEIW